MLDTEYVRLFGRTVPVPALTLLLDLERRDFDLRVQGSQLWVSPKQALTNRDRSQIREYKPHLLHLVAESQLPTRGPWPVTPLSPEVQWRLTAMVTHHGEHPVFADGDLPFAVARREPPSGPHQCCSCGDPLGEPYGRCDPCAQALTLFERLNHDARTGEV